MSRASMSTGNITFNTTTETSTPTPKPRDNDQAFHILITGDFTGRHSRGEFEPETLASRKIIEIDRDNFEDVFTQLDVQLKLPISDVPVKFEEFDDLHPDFLVERLDVFEKFQVLKRRLKNPDLFDSAVAEIQSWNPESIQQVQAPSEEDSGIPLPDNMLDAIFSQAPTADTPASPIGDVQNLIQSIVAPYAQAKEDPRLAELLEAVDEATAQTLRKIMHASDFQSIEANWRGLYFLVRRLETDSKLKLFIMDVSRDELIDDVINHNDFNDTALFKRLVTDYQVAGAVPFSIIQNNLCIEDDIDDLQLAASLANIASEHNGIALAAGSEKLAGCEAIANTDEEGTWQYETSQEFQPAWEAFRQDELAQYLALPAPRFMLRLPYGKSTSPIEAFDFEELPESEKSGHEYYVWGNSSHLVTLIVAETAQRNGGEVPPNTAGQIDGLPLHVYKEDGESVVKACAEVFIRDSEVEKFADAGLLSVRSIKDRDAVLVPVLRTVSKQGFKIFERS